jgi:hypothetical protein
MLQLGKVSPQKQDALARYISGLQYIAAHSKTGMKSFGPMFVHNLIGEYLGD